MCTKFDDDSSSHFFGLEHRQTDRQKNRQTRLNALPMPAAMLAWVMVTTTLAHH